MPIIITEEEIEAQDVNQLTQCFRANKGVELQDYSS